MFRIYPSGSCPVSGTAPYSRKSDITAPIAQGQRYDQVDFSTCLDETEKRLKETVGLLSQEIRSQVTAQDLTHLRQQIIAGEYRPDAQEIATRILLSKEGD